MPANSVFTHNLSEKVLPGLVTLGRYSADAISLTVATPANKILIYDLSKLGNRSDFERHARTLKMSVGITSVAAARFRGEDRDALLVCTKNRLYAYNVEENADIFTAEIADGANAVTHGTLAGDEVILVGGNCSVQGFSKLGVELYWVVAGDNVRSLALVDVDGDGENELVVGSDDYDIRVFKGDDLLHEVTETQIVTHVHCLGRQLYGYALTNGTVGVYEGLTRLWRVKSKNRATCLLTYDVNADGAPELVTGWQGGKIDGRNVRTGEVLFKDNLDQTIAGICRGDWRGSGTEDLIVTSITGEIRCYNPQRPKPLGARNDQLTHEEEAVRELLCRKQALVLELKKYEYNARYHGMENNDNSDGAIPARTRLQTSIGINLGTGNQVPHVEVNLSMNNDTIIRAAIVFAEGIFKDETHVKHPRRQNASSKLSISLYPPRDVPIDIHIKAFIGYRDSKRFHVFELTRQLPRFSMYTLVDGPTTSETVSNVVFFVNERIQRVILWINRNFMLSKSLDSSTYSDVALRFLSLRDGKELTFLMDPSGKITIKTDNITLAGDLIQSLATYLNLEQLKSVAHYPKEEESCIELLGKLQELESAKRRLNVDLSNKSNLVRDLIVRGEDARLLHDLKLMKRFYSELNQLNKDLRNGYEIRMTNYADIVNTVKDLNGLVQKASRLRFGKWKTDPVSLAKSAISTNNSSALIKAIRTGEA